MQNILKKYVDYIDGKKIKMFGICVQQHGEMKDSHRWTEDRPHHLFSMSKSYVSIAVGIAVDEGRFSIDDRVISFFPELVPDWVGEHTARMTVKDLLMMAAGISRPVLMNGNIREPGSADPRAEKDWAKVFLQTEPDMEPGKKFIYDSGCSYMLSRIIARATGQDMLDYLIPRLFGPLGIEDPVWDRCPLGYSLGGIGLRLKTADSLAFGQMLLQGGRWNGRRIVSEEWVREATTFKIATDDCGFFYDKSLGYGYQFWMGREGSFRASWAYGQGCFVIPGRDAVITYNADTDEMQALLEGMWDILIPEL